LHETVLDRGQAEETNMRSRIKVGGDVDVARRIRLAASRRAEQRQAATTARHSSDSCARSIAMISSAVALFILTFVFLAGLS